MTFDDRERAGSGAGVRSGGLMGLLAAAVVALSVCWSGYQIKRLAEAVAAGPGVAADPPRVRL